MKKVLKFSANICGPCKRYKQPFEDIKYELPDYEFISYNMEAEPAKFKEYNIIGLPTTIIIDDEVEQKRREGYMSLEDLHKFISDEEL